MVTEPARRAAIGEVNRACFERYEGSPSLAWNLHADDPVRAATQRKVGSRASWLAQHMGEVPVLMVACLQTGQPLGGGNQAGLWGLLLPAVWSYVLAARDRGLGTAWTTSHLAREAEVADILGLPEGVHQGALIPTTYNTGQTVTPAPRQPVSEVLHLQGW